jgi:dephospho-CoA kinase
MTQSLENNMLKNLPKVICLTGVKRSGKDTVAEYLCQKYGYKNIKISAPLKESLKVLFGFTEEELEGESKDKNHEIWDVTPRKVMQFFGTEVMQYKLNDIMPWCGRCFWIDRLIRENIDPLGADERVVISDMRFMHEYEKLVSLSCEKVFWRIERDVNGEHRKEVNTEHSSESELVRIPVNNIVKNTGTIDELYKTIERILRKSI